MITAIITPMTILLLETTFVNIIMIMIIFMIITACHCYDDLRFLS